MLPDLLKRNLTLVICGTAAGKVSWRMKRYYAGKGNKFWGVLYQVGLTPTLMKSYEYRQLLAQKIGLTDLIKGSSGMDRDQTPSKGHRRRLRAKMKSNKPDCVCFNGKFAAQHFLRRRVEFGLQNEKIGETRVFVAPSTSGCNTSWRKRRHILRWKELAEACHQS